MAGHSLFGSSRVRPLATVLCLVATLAIGPQNAQAQFINRAVGGVFVSPDGMLKKIERDELGKLKAEREKASQPISSELKSASALRKISLRRLEAAIIESQKTGQPLPDEIRYLAGLQRIQYVFVYPESNDIVLAGPGEGWRFDDQGEVVGAKSGRPVMLLDDLLVALRTAETARTTGITCSINPSNEGMARFMELASRLGQLNNNPRGAMKAIEDALGQQNITLKGVPAESHFGAVLVAADYKMKRLAMGFEKAPVKGMPSFLELMKGPLQGNMMPRWWLEPDYKSLVADPDGLAWEIRGAGIKAMTEEDFITKSGGAQQTGQVSPIAKQWADNMTSHYEELTLKEPIFGQLRNCIDLALVGALIVKEGLSEKSGCSLGVLIATDKLPSQKLDAPVHVDSKASVLKRGATWIITASGGVQINSWGLLEKSEASKDLAPVREKATGGDKSWWWD